MLEPLPLAKPPKTTTKNSLVADVLRELRGQAEITQEEMARRVNLTLSGYRGYEQGKRSLSDAQIPRFAEALDVPVSSITRRLWPQPPAPPDELVSRVLEALGPERSHHLSDVLREIADWPERDQDAVIQVIRAAVFSGAWGKRLPTDD